MILRGRLRAGQGHGVGDEDHGRLRMRTNALVLCEPAEFVLLDERVRI